MEGELLSVVESMDESYLKERYGRNATLLKLQRYTRLNCWRCSLRFHDALMKSRSMVDVPQQDFCLNLASVDMHPDLRSLAFPMFIERFAGATPLCIYLR
jgi:hypothetical protein